MKTGRTFNNLIAVILLIAATLIALYSGVGISYAATTNYSDVLDDLRQDSDFDVANYPAINDDYSLQVIQVAESVDGELFVYVYQPAARAIFLVARYLNMSLDTMADNTKQYNLTLLNTAGVFQKYRVEGLAVSSEETRYYNISNILRPFNSDVDEPPAEGQTVSAVPNKVGQLWTAQTVDGLTTYSMLTSEVIEITAKYVGYCVYEDGTQLGWGIADGMTKAYFVAFDTDKPIDKLISADLIFFATRIKCKVCNNTSAHGHKLLYDFHDEEYIDFGTGVYNNTPLTIDYTQKFSNQGGGNIRPANKYTWNRIRTTADFIADNNNKDYQMTSGGTSDISNTKWVLNFYEAQDKYKLDNVWLSFMPGFTKIPSIADADCELNDVYDVEILRLEFETEGKPYNLGVVDNKQTGGSDPINIPVEKDFFDWLASIFNVTRGQAIGIFILILIVICAPLLGILAYFIPPFGKFLLWCLKALLWLISAPFRLIALIVRKISERKEAPETGGKSNKAKTKAAKSRKSTPRSKSTKTRSKRK